MVYRLYVEKKKGYTHEADALLRDIRSFLQIKNLTALRVINRYDVENIQPELLSSCKDTIFSEKQLDTVSEQLESDAAVTFAVEYLPGQYDQRADSAAQCIQLASQGERPDVRTAKVYKLYGTLTTDEIAAIKKYVINPVESREASLDTVKTLKMVHEIPTSVKTLTGFCALSQEELGQFIEEYRLAMDLADIMFCQQYFISEQRDPTLTEIRMIDTYWSDHCRHTTFLTHLKDVSFEQKEAQQAYERYLAMRDVLHVTKPVTLMNLATIGAKYLKSVGKLNDLDESDEINACTVKVKVKTENSMEDWLLLFKNETHNHPTEIEPFGGAATCIGGAIRDPLSGRAYVYQAMRVTGAANPLTHVRDTIPGKLPQRKLVTTAANGYSSYGNQIGLSTGLVDEMYHPGYAAKHLEIGAVVGAAPQKNVRREEPAAGDVVVLLGGRTGRDGCGGATGSSKSHTLSSLEKCGAEVQKGNAPEERKLQRLFRDPCATSLIKRCNDFGAGGVSVAIGELADGLTIDLNAVPKKYEGLDGTELAISESQERMAVVLDKNDAEKFIALANAENLEATLVAVVTKEKRLVMTWNGKEIVNISRDFLNSNGAVKETSAHVVSAIMPKGAPIEHTFEAVAENLNVCSKRGLSERFDSTIGANTVLMPFGGKRQLTPTQAMAAKLPVPGGKTDDCSVMAYGCNPYLTEQSPYHGAYLSVLESVARLVATGAGWRNAHLTFQEYFERMTNAESWGKPLGALLGALDAQVDLCLAAIGGKDSMSGSFEKMHVPPTLCSFAINLCKCKNVISPEFKKPNDTLRWLAPVYGKNGLPEKDSVCAVFDRVTELIQSGKVSSAYTVGFGGIAEGLIKMALGNRIGVAIDSAFTESLFDYHYGAFILETEEDVGVLLGHTTEEYTIDADKKYQLDELEGLYDNKLQKVYPTEADAGSSAVCAYTYDKRSTAHPVVHVAKPRVLIPVFPGTNCEYDTAYAFERAGAESEILVLNNLTGAGVVDSAKRFAQAIDKAQIIFIPGGFSGGDEPDGSGKFITAFFRNAIIKDKVHELLQKRDGLIGGICNGFQALIKLGLVPYGEIREPDENAPTLTYNVIGRHQSRLVLTRVASVLSPWLMHTHVGDIHLTPVSHGEGRFIISNELLSQLAANGQIATQYVDENGVPSMDIRYNPNGSAAAVEGITSPDGRVFGKMAHSERCGEYLYKNVDGNKDNGMFRGAVDYFR